MIRVRRITDLDVLAGMVIKPKGAVPKFGLPKWKVMPLEHKIPIIPAPKNAYNFTRQKVGRKLWVIKTEPRIEFDLSDPYCHETNFPYEPLHDEHLREFFSKPPIIKHLLKADLITDDMDAKCSLRDYNAYRKYLRKIHANRIKKELRKRNCLFVEKRALCYAESQAQKEAKRLQEKEKLVNARQNIVLQRLLQDKVKTQKQKEKAQKTAQRLKLLKLVKQEERRLMNLKRKERTEQIRQKHKIAVEVARRKMIDITMDWKKKEKARTKIKDKRHLNIVQQKRKAMEERWERKQYFQEKDIIKEKVLLQCINTRRQQFIKDYNDKINKETARMQRLLDNIKLFTNCYVKRYLSDGRKRICCKKYLQSNMDRKEDKIKNDSQNSLQHLLVLTKQKKYKMQC